ncbi:hypothetical protein HIM_12207 [Hirsutella minnesotensis 3608]|uniref:HTH CENPB-type domain-containing protein n=1 Tax=Hirsutella minnesotensis 3608 TaxID=1043627 RepID=A0A0F7ZF25_9HYPO|nr:hypothetical protein HIM_12207 [Hirsutella minnesotensis 3608]
MSATLSQSIPRDERVLHAVHAYQQGQFTSIRKAAIAYDIPPSTISDRLRGVPPRRDAQMNNQKLTVTEETALVQWILSMDERGMPPTVAYTRRMANLLLSERGKDLVGENWVRKFVGRHGEIKAKYSTAKLPLNAFISWILITAMGHAQPVHANGKGKQPAGHLATPEPTPGVEDARIAADIARRVEDAKQQASSATAKPSTQSPQDAVKAVDEEIERIMKCPKDAYAEILAVDPSSSDTDKLTAWRRLGCMMHPQYCQQQNAKDAFEKLQDAASKIGVDEPFIGEVYSWDGKADLEAHDDSDEEETDDGRMDEDEIPIPPTRVNDAYRKATPLLHKLGEDPENDVVLTQLKEINDRIRDGNKSENAKAKNVNEQVPDSQWLIPVSFFGPHYKLVLEQYYILHDDPENQTARARISSEKRLIDALISKHHFPAEWTVTSADEYLKQRQAGVATTAAVPAETSKVEAVHIDYPWPTARAADGGLIVGVRRHGPWGTQVCIERAEEGGQVIRRLESASEVGLLEVEKYKATDGHKVLSDGQSAWSSKDRSDFEELLWVTKSQTHRKNRAAGSKDPAADCCVRFRKKGINILTVTSLGRVLGRTSANAQIDNICKRDGILPPWQAGYVSSFEDPAKVEKDAVRRRALKDSQARQSLASERQPQKQRSHSDSSEGRPNLSDTSDQRLWRLEAMMIDMAETQKTLKETMATMAQLFERFMRANMASLEASSK